MTKLGWMLMVGAAATITGAAHAERFILPLDPAQSNVTATLNLIGQVATDSSPVTGFVDVNLATVGDPRSVTGFDFRLALTEDLILNVSFGIFGSFNSVLDDLVILYATPGVGFGPTPITAGAFTFVDVPANTAGFLRYTATGLVCSQFTGAGLPCVDVDDLTTEPTQLIQFDGTLAVNGRTVTFVGDIDRTAPVDPMNPGLGTIRVVGTVRGSVRVPPLIGDANQDCVVSFADITTVLASIGATGDGVPGDSNDDGSVGFADVTATLASLGSSCG